LQTYKKACSWTQKKAMLNNEVAEREFQALSFFYDCVEKAAEHNDTESFLQMP